MKSATHEELMQSLMFVYEDKLCITNTVDHLRSEVIAELEDVNPKYVNLLQAAQAMYKCIYLQYDAIDKMIAVLEFQPECQEAISSMLLMQNAMLISQRIALEGIDEVFKSLGATIQ